MNRNQFILMKLAEECAEVAQRAIKSMQFGAEEVQNNSPSQNTRPETSLTNKVRLNEELVDLLIIVALAAQAGEVSIEADIVFDDFLKFRTTREDKIKKLNKYLAYSRELGTIPGDWTI